MVSTSPLIRMVYCRPVDVQFKNYVNARGTGAPGKPVWNPRDKRRPAMKPRLQYLMAGAFVTELQRKLNQLMPHAAPPLAVDGKFGDRTLSRVKEFQRARGLNPDGIVGSLTWAVLDGAPSAPHPGAPPPALNPAVQALLVRHGHMLHCNYGAGQSRLRLDDSSRVATVKDCAPGTNIPGFGSCRSPHHPSVFAMQDPFRPHTHNRPVSGFIACTPMPAYGAWRTHGKAVDPQTGCHLLLRGAQCPCQFGGVIKLL